MPDRPAEFWAAIPSLVTSKVAPVLERKPEVRAPVIEYLRDLEVVARRECVSRDAVQVIASGRRLLGDRTSIGKGMGSSFQKGWARRA
jgi:hypothetical protein